MRRLLYCFVACVSIAYSQYSLRVENAGGAKNSSEKNIFRAVLLKNGSTISTVERVLPFDVPFPSTVINETTGMFVLNYTFDGFVEVYNGAGKKQWEQNFFKEMKPNYERTITIAVGNTAIGFLTSDVTLPNAVVHRFTLEGKQEWERSLPYAVGYEIALSPDEQTIAAGSYLYAEGKLDRSAALVNMNGKITGSADILFRSAAFSPDGSVAAFASEREVVVYNVTEKKETARIGRKTEGVITNIIWSGRELFVQESAVTVSADQPFFYSDPVVIKYSAELKEVGRTSYSVERFRTSSLKVVSGSLEMKCDSRVIRVD